MACQSLDNDEILNVRWATEDPNPTSKVEERERLETMGREAIQAKMDPRIIEAMRAVRALEEGAVLEDEEPIVEDSEDAPPAKRRKLEIESNGSTAESPGDPQGPPKLQGLLSADTLESLKYFTEIRHRNAQANGTGKTALKPPPPTGLGLGGYGSDEDD